MNRTLAAIEADRKALLAFSRELEDSVWAEESGCAGWSVQDVVSHLACSFWLAVDPTELPDPAGLPAERAADLYVASRRAMTPEQVVADYESVSSRALDVLAALDGQEADVPLGDVGTYPAALVPNAFAFEHYVHIRFDLLPPGGPVRATPPVSDELRLAPTLDWIEAALPQQNAELLARMDKAVEISLTGPGARVLRVGDAAVAAHITSDSDAFVRWVTHRGGWESLGVHAEGEPATLETVRRLSVF